MSNPQAPLRSPIAAGLLVSPDWQRYFALLGAVVANAAAAATDTQNIRTVTAATSFSSSDYTILGDATAGGFIVQLPSAPGEGDIYNLKKIDSTTNAVTLAGNGHSIDGNPSVAMTISGTSLEVQFDGSEWRII